MATRNGTPSNDTLTGTASADSLFGLGGNDSLLGLGGSDRLEGGGGNDTLVGGGGIDTLIGGGGNDTYIVDNTADVVTEVANSGIDTVQSSVNYTLGSSLDNLTLTGTSAIKGTGNSLNNIITGNAANNFLNGGAGNDNLIGGAGNDQLISGRGNDRLNGGNGNDILTGSTSNLVGERDTLTGGTGADLFVLGNVNQVFYDDRNRTTGGRDDYALVTDFNLSNDVIQLRGTSDNYVLATSPAGLPAGTAIYLNKSGSEPDELIAIVQGSTSLSLDGDYFKFTAEFDLADLNGSNGFKINGINADDQLGFSVSEAGDVNGDGFDDLIVGARSADPNGQLYAGESYVVFGSSQGFSANLDLSTLNGSNGFKLNGINADDSSGSSVSSAGDVNGDGFDDIIIGAPNATPNGQLNAGESYVVFGSSGGFNANLNLNTLNGSNGFKINGTDDLLYSGSSVSSAGDVNGDGFDDIIIGAPSSYYNDLYPSAGESYVVFGSSGGFNANLNVSALNGSNGFKINGINTFDYSGSSVSSAGDVNGDGFDDILIGAYGASPNDPYNAGSSYVVFGSSGGFSANLNLSALNGSNGFKINGIDADDSSGFSVSSAGDVNGDDFDDILIGARRADPNGQLNAGESYVVFGSSGGFSANLNLSALNGSNGFKINGIDAEDFSGRAVSSAGDVNGDGFDDILIGARGADPNGQSYAGESYVVFGSSGGFSANFNLSTLNSSNGFKINGIDADDSSGYSVSSAGDVNGDGFDDLVIGGFGTDPNGQDNAGESYVIFGRDFTDSVTNAGTAGNDTLTGTAGDDILIGGLGNDRLIGGLGIDVLIGGAGNDTLSFGAIDRRLDGGSGVDTLRINGSDNIDLTTIANNKFTAFEIIDITGTGNNSLAFTRLDLLDLSDTTNRLIVNGNAGDQVTSTGQGWAFGGTTTLDSILYRQYTSGAATLLVDADVTTTIT